MGDTTQVYDISGEKPVLGEVPHEDLQAAISSGKYSLPKGQEVHVVSPDGSFGTIPAEDAPKAFQSGYQYATPSMLSQQQDKETYGTTGQQVMAGLEGAAQGVAGPLAPLAERALGVNPEDIRKRAEVNPWTHGLSEAAGFGAGLFTGASEASLIGKAGEAAAQGVTKAITGGVARGGGEYLASRLAGGAARMATEMGLFQASDEASKVILDAPTSVGNAAANVGLSALIGGVAGIPLTGVGMGLKSIANSQFIRDFTDRLSYRGANLNPNEALQGEVENAVNAYHEMGSEIGGVNGMKSQALRQVMPEMSDTIAGQIPAISQKLDMVASEMEKRPFKFGSRVPGLIREGIEDLEKTGAEAQSPGDIFDRLQDLKREFDSSIPKNLTPDNADYHALKMLRDATGDIRKTLENPSIWGDEVANLQKEINSAWHSAINPVKQIEGKFFSKVGNELKIDPAKFNTYISQAGRVNSPTNRQEIMRVFADALDKFSSATDSAYEKAGVENPFKSIGMTSIRDSVNTPSMGTKLADAWFDKLGPYTMGNAIGGGIGGVAGHATGIPEAGFAGAYLGRWVLGPLFGSIIKPMMESGANLSAFKQTLGYAKAVLAGNEHLSTSAAGVFATGAKTIPTQLMASRQDLEKLDDKLKDVATNQNQMLEVAGNLGHYFPGHAQELSKSTMTAVNYLNSLRPTNAKANPLDSEIPVSKAQMASYYRALAVAQQPLTALHRIKEGTLVPQDIQTLKTVYPAYYDKMSQELMGAMTDHISKGGTVPYQVRQSASLFLGQPLDSTMSPSSIQSIQAGFMKTRPAQQAQNQAAPQQSTKKSPSKLGKLATDLRTNDQSRASRTSQGG